MAAVPEAAAGGGRGGDQPASNADPVVRTLNVYLSQSVSDGAQLFLLQSPLRPPSRPYELAEAEDVRFKVRA